jgi:hypothetical protein
MTTTGVPAGKGMSSVSEGSCRAVWLPQARSYLRRADPVLARLIDVTGHPVIRSYEPGENWYWCYLDQLVFELQGAPPAPSHP